MIIRATSPADLTAALTYIAPRVGETPESLVWTDPFVAFCAVRGGNLVGVVIYNSWRGRSIETHWAGERGWLTRAHLREIFAYPFLELGCLRISGVIRRDNRTARAAAEKIGFKLEGVARKGYADGSDAMLYGITNTDCRWLQ